MNLSLGFSPCPNDTYIFEALVNKHIELNGYEFDFAISDVEKLNQQVFENNLDVTKLSIAAYAHVSENYQLLPYGSALGYKNGPLLISKKKIYPDEVPYLKIAIPGKLTTAVLLLGIFWPEAKQLHEYLFSDIEEIVLSGEADAGLIIHETRFTYRKKGLHKIADLGETWEKQTSLPLPLGGIAIKRSFSEIVKNDIGILIKNSLEFANRFPEASAEFIKKNAQEISEEITKQHIQLYVNKFSFGLGEEGKKAIMFLLNKGFEKKMIPKSNEPVFI
jgi:1,4-dihydroxy-6-naphthoate synthase